MSTATAARSSGCPRGQAGAFCWVPGEVSHAVLSGQAAQTQTFCPAPTEGWTMAGDEKAEQLQERRQWQHEVSVLFTLSTSTWSVSHVL